MSEKIYDGSEWIDPATNDKTEFFKQHYFNGVEWVLVESAPAAVESAPAAVESAPAEVESDFEKKTSLDES